MRAASPKTLYVITVHSEEYRNNLFFDEVRRGINIEANLQGVNVEFLFGFEHDIKIFSDALGIIFAPDGSLKCKKFIEGIKKVHRVPVVQIDNQVLRKKYAPPFDAFVGIDNEHGGKVTAEYVKSFLPKQATVLVISGSKKLSYLSYHQRLVSFRREIGRDARISEIIYGAFDHHTVYKETFKLFSHKKDYPDAIFAFNDDSAIVAYKVLETLKVKKQIVIAGFDGSAAGRAALSKGTLVCSYDQDPEYLGRKAFQIFLDILHKRTFHRINLIRSTLLTQKNIGNTFYAGVTNFLDRSLTPFSFRKRRYEMYPTSPLPKKTVSDFKNELVCPIYFGATRQLPAILKQIDTDRFILISDDGHFLRDERKRIKQLCVQAHLPLAEAEFPAGEKNKNPKTLLQLTEKILKHKITKKSCLVLLGGGVTGNVGGFAASILYRGLRFVHVPTTLMHMVDSSTGGKQAVDTSYGKNTLGSFYEPEFIFINDGYLRTLPARELRNGLAECVKHSLCQDEKFYQYISLKAKALIGRHDDAAWTRIVEETIQLKLSVLDKDSYEMNQGMALVYGHTIGHAVESASRYRLTHGEAVSIGMVAAAQISLELGICGRDLVKQHIDILNKVGLPTKIPAGISVQEVQKFLKYDKKYVDSPMTFVLLSGIGRLHMKNGIVPTVVPSRIVQKVIENLSH